MTTMLLFIFLNSAHAELSYRDIPLDASQAECMREKILAAEKGANAPSVTTEDDSMIEVNAEDPLSKCTGDQRITAPNDDNVLFTPPRKRDDMNPPAAKFPPVINTGVMPKNWVLRLYFGPTTTQYFRTDIKINNEYMNLQIKEVKLVERNDFEAYEVWSNTNGFNPLQFFDEATNTGVISFENTKHKFAINLVVFHPKVLISDGEDKRTDQHVDMYGDWYGKPVMGDVRLGDYISGYRLTYGFMNYQAQIEKIVTIFSFKKNSSLNYVPGVSLGMYMGGAHIGIHSEKDYWTFLESPEQPFAIIGYSYSLSNKLTYIFPNDVFSISLVHQLTAGHLDYRAFSGRASQEVDNQTFSLSIGVKILKSKTN